MIHLEHHQSIELHLKAMHRVIFIEAENFFFAESVKSLLQIDIYLPLRESVLYLFCF